MTSLTFVARNYPPTMGGAQLLNERLARHLTEICHLHLIRNRRASRSPIFLMKSSFQVARLASQGALDGILLSDAALSPLIPLGKKLSDRVVLQVYGLDLVYPNPFYLAAVRRLLPYADHIISISEFTRDICISMGVDLEKCSVIRPGIDSPLQSISLTPDRISAARKFVSERIGSDILDKVLLLSVGRLIPRKGIRWFVSNVVPRLSRTGTDFRYLIVGKGPEGAKIAEAARDAEVSHLTHLVGAVPTIDLWQYYLASDIFIMPNVPVPNDVEGFGLVVQEAGCFGLPVVASRIDGVGESVVHDGVCGVLVRSLDVEAFLRATRDLILNAPLTIQSRERIRRRVIERNHSWKEAALDYFRIVVGENNRGPRTRRAQTVGER